MDDGMEVIFEDDHLEEDDAGLQEEDIVVVKFGPHHRSTNATKSGPKGSTIITRRPLELEEDVSRTKSNVELEHTSLRTRKRQKTKTGRANTAATTTTATKLRPETTRESSTRQIITQIFSSTSPHAHSDVHTYPLPPDQPHRHSYHSPLLLSFPSSTESFSAQDSIAAARKHRDALLTWFDKYSAAHQMPWRKPWVDTSPLLCPGGDTPSTSAAITTASASASKPTTSSSKPTSISLVGPIAKALPSTIPDSALLFPNLAASTFRAQVEVKAEATSESPKQAQTLQALHTTISQRFYEVLLFEIMRQVIHEPDYERMIERVSKHYNRWIKALPTMEDLAKAGEDEVEGVLNDIHATRLHNRLHKAAMQVCAAGLPSTVEELQKLPGVGQHTAGLVAAVVFGRAEPMVDWNVNRVLARQLGIRGDVNKKESKEVIWEAARRLVEQVAWDGVEAEEEAKATWLADKKGKRKDMNEGEKVVDMSRRNRGPAPLGDRPGRWGQALIELGAVVCLPAPERPACDLCPIQTTCRAYAEGLEIAREKGLVVGNKTTRKEKDRQTLKQKVDELLKQNVVDIEDAACTLCPPPPSLPPSLSLPPGHPSDASSKKIKMENQDEIQQPGEEDTDRDTDVHYLGTVLKTPLPNTKEKTQNTQNTQTNKDENTISTTFYERSAWLRTHVNLKRSKPKPSNLLDPTAREFITTYCAQYPYTKPKAQKQSK